MKLIITSRRGREMHVPSVPVILSPSRRTRITSCCGGTAIGEMAGLNGIYYLILILILFLKRFAFISYKTFFFIIIVEYK